MLKKLFITWVTNNSRYSERMKTYKVNNKEGFFLDLEDRKIIYNLIVKKLQNKGIENFTLNVLSDHVHLIIIYEEEKLSKLIGEIKGGVSFEFLKLKGYTKTGDGKGNKLWAKGFSKTFLNNWEDYEKAIDYTLNNHIKHNIESIYQ